MDILQINGLQADIIIGLYEWERKLKQKIFLDLELGLDIGPAAEKGTLEKSINYAEVCQKLTHFLEASHYQLLETLAEQTAQFLLQNFDLIKVKLKITKIAAINNIKDIAIIIER